MKHSKHAPNRGYTLIELLLVMALSSLLVMLGYPPFLRASSAMRLHLAADQVAGALQTARLYAIRYSAYVAVKFRTEADGSTTYALYRDGDGDGVSNRDIIAGTDPVVWAPRPLSYLDGDPRLGFPPGPPPRHPGNPSRRLDRLEDPIRFNLSDLASFGPLGTATPGSIYLCDDYLHLAAVRVDSMSGSVVVVTYDRESETWK